LNNTIIISKTLKTLLTRPHGNCSYYDGSSGQPFGAKSHNHCMRRCQRKYIKILNKCNPLFINYYCNELDFQTEFNETFCFNRYDNENQLNVIDSIKVNCLKYCPKDCLTVEYNSR